MARDEGKDKDQEKDKDLNLHDVMIEEQSRGRRPVDMKTRRERERLRRELRRLLEAGDERGFIEAIRSVGLKDGSAEFWNALRAWREFQGR